MSQSVLSSLNMAKEQTGGKISAKESLLEHDDESSSIKTDASETMDNDTNNNLSNKHKNAAGRMLSVKNGRKRFSSIVGRIKAFSNKANGRSQGQPDNLSDCSDSEEDAYKSAEDACRKMSLSENPAASQSRRPLMNKQDRKNSASRAAAAAAAQGPTEVSSYEELKQDKKYILPEELCDIPTFLHVKNCDPNLIEETRQLLKERYAKNPENFYETDYQRMLTDDWSVSRFLLRRRLDPKRTAKLMEECGRFRRQYKMSELSLWEFPIEFHKAGGLFKYAPDRVGNITMYMRVKMYRRVPEISDVFKAFILCVLEQCDKANNGRGTAVIFDLSSCGLQNVDLGFLSWLLSSFRNYCPKGVSYIIVYNLPWILNATCKLAMTWMSASNRRALRFVYGDEIENFIEKRNLPDYLGGYCKINYRAIPEGSKPAIEACDRIDMTREQAIKIRELFKEYLDESDEETHEAHQDASQMSRKASNASALDDSKSHYDDAKSSTSFENVDLDAAINTTSTNPNGRTPVVDLVSQASRFIAH